MSQHPYTGLPSRAFWKQAVSERNAMELDEVYLPLFPISKDDVIVAAGSCFAQHIGKQFKVRGFNYLDAEPPPELLPESEWQKFGYDIYSARYGNIYSARQLVQTFARARGEFAPLDAAWSDGERFYDPYRPTIEPDGFASLEEMQLHQRAHLEAVNGMLSKADLFVFTFGLTEAWENVHDGAIYPTCPGTHHGEFDPESHRFVNFRFSEVLADFEEFIAYARSINPQMRFLLTVSPVPLVATASGNHVLPATYESKSILRAVCGELYEKYDFVDYFPSYELVSSHPMRAQAYDPNLRTVSRAGVAQVMETFFRAHDDAPGDTSPAAEPRSSAASTRAKAQDIARTQDDVVCDEMILESFRQ